MTIIYRKCCIMCGFVGVDSGSALYSFIVSGQWKGIDIVSIIVVHLKLRKQYIQLIDFSSSNRKY